MHWVHLKINSELTISNLSVNLDPGQLGRVFAVVSRHVAPMSEALPSGIRNYEW